MENQTVTDKTMTWIKFQEILGVIYSGALTVIINYHIPYINELSQHKKHIVIKELLEK